MNLYPYSFPQKKKKKFHIQISPSNLRHFLSALVQVRGQEVLPSINTYGVLPGFKQLEAHITHCSNLMKSHFTMPYCTLCMNFDTTLASHCTVSLLENLPEFRILYNLCDCHSCLDTLVYFKDQNTYITISLL